MLSSRSCPMPVMIGKGKFATFSANTNVSKPLRSAVAPPPRMITTQSNSSSRSFILFNAATMLCSTCSPCIVAPKSSVWKLNPYSLPYNWLQKSPYPAAEAEEITAMRCANKGRCNSLCRSNTPSAFSCAMISCRLRAISPIVYSGLISSTIHEKPYCAWNWACTCTIICKPARSCTPATRSKWGPIINQEERQHLAEARAMGILVLSSFSISSK